MTQTIYFDQQNTRLNQLLSQLAVKYDPQAMFELNFVNDCLMLFKRDEPKLSGIYVDFVSGALAHRRQFGGGRGQAIAKAVGLKKGENPTVLDATAGLGRDAFVLASLGCNVTLLERHPVVRALLMDGLARGYQDPIIGDWLAERLTLSPASSIGRFKDNHASVDVVYLDPMYPHREKSALVKKEMRVFQSLVGADLDADDLLTPALSIANKKVVVKRPDYATPLAMITPTNKIETKKNRFDVYVKAAMKK